MSAWVIAVANHKGGVGKTTTVLNLGYVLSHQYHTLLIDLDPQGSLTKSTMVQTGNNHLGQVLGTLSPGTKRMSDIIVPLRSNLDLIPSAPELAATEMSMGGRPSNESILLEAINQVDSIYQIILIDCPPGIGMLTVNALYGAHAVIIPTQLDAHDISGIALFIDTMTEVRTSYGDCAELLGILATITDTRTKQEHHFLEALVEQPDLRLFKTTIPRSIKVREARAQHLPIVEYDARNPVSRAYQKLSKEVMERAH